MHDTEILMHRNNHFGINVFPNMNRRFESRNTHFPPDGPPRRRTGWAAGATRHRPSQSNKDLLPMNLSSTFLVIRETLFLYSLWASEPGQAMDDVENTPPLLEVG